MRDSYITVAGNKPHNTDASGVLQELGMDKLMASRKVGFELFLKKR